MRPIKWVKRIRTGETVSVYMTRETDFGLQYLIFDKIFGHIWLNNGLFSE